VRARRQLGGRAHRVFYPPFFWRTGGLARRVSGGLAECLGKSSCCEEKCKPIIACYAYGVLEQEFMAYCTTCSRGQAMHRRW